MGIISDLLKVSDDSVDWSAENSGDRTFAEGKQDAARHTDWMASTAAMLEEGANKTMKTDKVRENIGDAPADFLEYLGRAIGGAGAMTLGAGVEGIGMLKAGGQAVGAAAKGEFRKAGGIISEAASSSAMDLHNNMAGAYSFSQIKDPEQRRAAILKASESAGKPTPGIPIGVEDALSGELVRRR